VRLFHFLHRLFYFLVLLSQLHINARKCIIVQIHEKSRKYHGKHHLTSNCTYLHFIKIVMYLERIDLN